jgi:hypothetical protein
MFAPFTLILNAVFALLAMSLNSSSPFMPSHPHQRYAVATLCNLACVDNAGDLFAKHEFTTALIRVCKKSMEVTLHTLAHSLFHFFYKLSLFVRERLLDAH